MRCVIICARLCNAKSRSQLFRVREKTVASLAKERMDNVST